MPVSFNSPPRNFFLLGSSGEDIITNFFNNIDQSTGTDGQFHPDEIRYNYSDQKYILAGSAEDSNSKGFGWFEKRDYDGTSALLDWDVRLESVLDPTRTSTGVNTTLRALELDSNDNLIVVGKSGDAPWIAKYSNGGVIDWQATTFSGDVEYTGITSDASGNYYACGNTPTSGEAQAFVEKFDGSGTPGWGKSAFMLGRDVELKKIAVNSRGHVVAVGSLEDDNAFKGYIVKLDTTTGDVLWDRTLESFEILSASEYKPVLCESVFIDNKDQIYVVGRVFNIADTRGFIIKYSPEGNIIWQKETPDNEHFEYYDVKSDGDVEQTIVLGRYLTGSDQYGVLTKYSKNGDIVFRRLLSSSYNTGANFGRTGLGGAVNLDADPSFYYLLFVDDAFSGLNGTPDTYTFGKVSTSGNGFGNFQYDDGNGETIDYDLSTIGDRIGKLSDGSVRNDTSDLTTYPFGANQILFDDLATQVSNKRRQMDGPDSFEYSGSPAIRPADFQELNLLGDVYSGSGDWLDQSGNGNDAQVEFTITTTLPGTTESENFRTVTSSYSTYGTVAENTVTNDLPYNNADWSHYGGKVRDLQTGGFRIDLTGNSTGTDFFMACWIKFDTYATSRQMGIDLFGDYVYWETLANGAIAVRHNGGSRADSSATSLNDGNWHHIALSRVGSTLYGMLDGSNVISTTSGVSGNSVNTNENFWFFGGSGNAYITDAKILDPIICIGSGTSSYTVPTEPVIDANGTFPNAAPHVPFFSNNWAYISPAIAIPGATTTTTNSPTHNSAGYWEFDGVDDYISGNTTPLANTTEGTIEAWIKTTSTANPGGHIYGESLPGTFTYWAHFRLNGSVLHFVVDDDTVVAQANGSSTVNDGSWHHVAITGDGTNWTFYVDGVAETPSFIQGDGTKWFNDAPGLTHYSIGALDRGTRGNFFDGEIGEVRVYPRALTAAAVFQNYNATKSKYINEAPDTAPKISSDNIVYDSNLLLNYDFGNRATYDRAENLVAKSEDFSGTEWASGGTQGKCDVINTDIISPFGTKNVQLLDDTATGADGQATDENINIPASNSQDYCFSVYAKKGTAAKFDLYLFYTNVSVVGYRLTYVWDTDFITAGGAEGANGVAPDYGYEDVGNGWYRFWLSASDQNLNTQVQARIYPASRDTGPTGSTYFWGAQVEKGSTPGRYIRTYGSAITAPTTVKNLSSKNFPATITSATFDNAGYFEFDGTNSEIITDDNIGQANLPLTYECWVRTANGYSPSDYVSLMSTYESDNLGMWINLNPTNAYVAAGNDGSTFFVSTTSVDDGNWHHVSAVLNIPSLRVYVDGVDVGGLNNAPNNNIPSANRFVRIGSMTIAGSSDRFFDGDIAEARIYNRALSSTEVSQNFNATKSKYGY